MLSCPVLSTELPIRGKPIALALLPPVRLPNLVKVAIILPLIKIIRKPDFLLHH